MICFVPLACLGQNLSTVSNLLYIFNGSNETRKVLKIVLYFVSPRERPWRQRVFQTKTLVIARTICVFSHTFKKKRRDLKGCVLQSESVGALSDVAVVLWMRQSIVDIFYLKNSKSKEICLIIILCIHFTTHTHPTQNWMYKMKINLTQ